MSADMWQCSLGPASHVVGRRLDETFFIVNLETNAVFELNGTGTEIWLWIEEKHSLDGCLDHLRAKFDVDASVLKEQVESLVAQLLREGLLASERRVPSVEVVGPARNVSNLPPGTWVLRWEPDAGKPRIDVGDGEAPDALEVFETPAGDIVLFDGYLFDMPSGGRLAAARHVADAYAERAENFLHALRGGFFTAVWDRKNNRLVAGRDGMGLHPCYYFWNERLLLMSSSVDALLAQPEVSKQPHVTRIAEYLLVTSFSHHLHETFYRDIRRVPPAHMLEVRGTTMRVVRYWNPLPLGFSWATEDELAQFESTLRRAVERCISVGAQALAMSGGFDSVGIAAVAADLRGPDVPPLSALSVRFPDTECNEEVTQARVARVLGMPQHFRTVNPAALDEDFVASALAQSAGNSGPVLGLWQGLYSTLFVTARDLGLRRILFGTGGDEMLVVDTRYAHDLFLHGDVHGLVEFTRAWQRTSPFSAFHVAQFILWQAALKPILISGARRVGGAYGAKIYHLVRNRLHPLSVPLREGVVKDIQDRARKSVSVELGPGEGRYVEAMRDLPQTPSLSLELEQGREWAGRFGVRILYPFFDRDFVELALRVHPRHLYQGGRMKGPLRELVTRKLPSVMMPVRKVDFTVLGRDVLRRFGRNTWSRLRGATKLSELGIVDPRAADELMEQFFSGRSERWVPVWQLLSTEAWLAARFARS
ncbi:MAG: PqqD family peptide modification chaperone [Polyangiaceae bacterium]|nr:PqqD family peptide modification chaperone [Polyangiaceae bacterium]